MEERDGSLLACSRCLTSRWREIKLVHGQRRLRKANEQERLGRARLSWQCDLAMTMDLASYPSANGREVKARGPGTNTACATLQSFSAEEVVYLELE
jgi:hypothetical protein